MESLLVFIALLTVTCLVGHWLHLKRIHWVTEGALALLVGLAAGGAAYAYFEVHAGERIPTKLFYFDTELFFDVALPAIIFNAGFSVKKKLFFQNFMTLVLFGVVGTFLTAAAIAAGSYYTLGAVDLLEGDGLFSSSLALGAIFASSDSIATLQILDQEATPLLYSLVFGEGVVNDATSIVLLRAIQKIGGASHLTGATVWQLCANFTQLFIFSLLLGVAVGLLSAYIIKHAFVRHSTDREVLMVALLGFLAFLLAEVLQLSGIFAVFFAGITMSHYTWHSLSPSAKVVTVYLFRIISFLTELFLFIYAGFACWSTSLWHKGIYSRASIMGKAGVLAASLLGQVFAWRGAVLMLLVVVANLWRPKSQRIGLRNATVIWWAGSARGAITIALAYHRFAGDEKKEAEVDIGDQVLVVASMAVVIFTTVVLGAVTGPFLDYLIGGGAPEGPTRTLSTMTSGGLGQPLLGGGGLRMIQKLGHWNQRSYIYDWWHKLDGGFLQPLFGGRKRPEGYHSPPPSPGRQNMYDVIGPHVLKRYSTAQRSSGLSGVGSGASGAEHPVSIPEDAPTSSPPPPGVASPPPRSSLEELFTRRSSRLDEDEPGLGAGTSAAAGSSPREHSGTSTVGRHGKRQVSEPPQSLWPSPFDSPYPQEEEEEELEAEERAGELPGQLDEEAGSAGPSGRGAA